MCDFNAVGGRFPFLKRKDRKEEKEISRSTRKLNEESSVGPEKEIHATSPQKIGIGRYELWN